MKILSAKQFNCKLKATVQQTGKLSFNDETVKALSLNVGHRVKFFMEGEPEQLHMAIVGESDCDAFPLKKSGSYYYVPTQLLFDELGVDYKRFTVIYDLVRAAAYDEEAGGQCFRMNYRPIKKKSYDDSVE